jgi:DNA ligase-1
MSVEGTPDFIWWVFDYWTGFSLPYQERYKRMCDHMGADFLAAHSRVKLLPHTLINNEDELNQYEDVMVTAGYEGIMLRSLNGPYKYGRSTTNEGYLLKLKRFADAEAVVIGFEERMHNANEATVDERGYTKRSSHQANLVPTGTLGALLVRDVKTNVEFSIGSGFDDVTRKKVWDLRSGYLGQLVTYKHFDICGVKDKPRIPTFKAFRDRRDV